MNLLNSKGRWSGRAALLGSILALSPALPAPAQTNQAAQPDLQEVVVTARKRAEKLEDVPASVQAFTAEDIEARGIVNPADFLAETPGVTFIQTQNAGTSFVVIRGIAQARNSEPSVAVVVDGVQQINPSQFNQSLFDIQDIEILKGPQGGLYGRNAIGGAILINTKEPTDSFQFKTHVGVDNGPGVTASQTVSGPITDALKFIGTVQYENTDGYIKNDYLDQSADPEHDISGRFKLLYKPSAETSADLRVSFSSLNTTGFWYNSYQGPNNVNADTITPVLVNNKGIDRRDMVDISAKLDHNFGFATLTSVTAYDKVKEIVTGDNYPYLPLAQGQAFYGFGDLNQSQYLNTSAVSEDIRLTSSQDGWLHWMGGAYAVHTDRFISTTTLLDEGFGVYPVYRGPSTNPLNPSLYYLADSQNNWAWAVYGDVAAELTKQIELDMQLRYDDDRRQNRTLTPNSGCSIYNGIGGLCLIGGAPTGQVRNVSFSAVQPKFTLRYKPEDNVTLYADWGRGFRSGGFNQTGVGQLGIPGVGDIFQAEVANTWEVGGKTELFDRRLSLDGSLYYTTSHNPYFFEYVATNATQNLGNINEAIYEGFDIAANYKLTDHVSLSAGYGYTNSRITQAPDPTWIGNQAPDVSKYNLTTALQYRQPLGDNSLFGRLEYQRIGTTWWTPGADLNCGAPTYTYCTDTSRSPVDLVNLRVSFSHGDWEIAGWAKNLFDKKYNAEYSPGGFSFRGLPLTFGFDASVWW